MDRISALRNVEAALTEFEQGETDLDGLERQVQAVLRTYVTDFEDERTAVYVVDASDEADAAASDDDVASGTADETGTAAAADATATDVVVVAGSPGEARDRASEIAGIDCDRATVERLSESA